MILDPKDLNEEQLNFIKKYQAIHTKLESLGEKMDSIRDESENLIKELQTLRTNEKKLFKNGKK